MISERDIPSKEDILKPLAGYGRSRRPRTRPATKKSGFAGSADAVWKEPEFENPQFNGFGADQSRYNNRTMIMN